MPVEGSPNMAIGGAMRLDKTDTAQYLATMEYDFTAADKQQILRACLMGGGAGSLFTEQTDRLLRSFARALKMSEPQFAAVLDEMLRPVAPAPATQSPGGGRG